MTTRTGVSYKPMMENGEGEESAGRVVAATADGGAAPLTDLLRLLLED